MACDWAERSEKTACFVGFVSLLGLGRIFQKIRRCTARPQARRKGTIEGRHPMGVCPIWERLIVVEMTCE